MSRSSNESEGAADHLPVLDGLRGAAMLLVFLNHAIAGPLKAATAPVDVAVRTIADAGWIAVDLFFVLSGFLITGILLDTKGQPGWWQNFVARRALRIFPAYYGALVVVFVVLPGLVRWSNPEFTTLQSNQAWYWGYAVNVLVALTHGRGAPLYTAHFWSLAIEEQFYLVWPLVVWAATSRALLRLAAAAVIAGLVWRLVIVLHDPTAAGAAYTLTPGRLDGLMTGSALAVVARSPGGLVPLRAAAQRVVGVGMLAFGTLGWLRGGWNTRDPVVALVAYPLVAMIFGALLVVAVTAPSTSWLSRTLSRATLRSWGKYSYGIYLVHFPLVGALLWKTTFYQRETALLGGSRLPSVLLFAGVVMSLSYALGWLSYHLYEKRFLALKRYFGRRRSAVMQPQHLHLSVPV
jgi:peptidoglycan/LPS O-acetylase OafA/YrhL